MRTQADFKARVVALSNLAAMTIEVSGEANKYWIEKVSRSRVWVGYSNANEYGVERPFFGVYPCYPNPWGEVGNPYVVLDLIRIAGNDKRDDPGDNDAAQDLEPLTDSPTLFRDPNTGEWKPEPQLG